MVSELCHERFCCRVTAERGRDLINHVRGPLQSIVIPQWYCTYAFPPTRSLRCVSAPRFWSSFLQIAVT